MDFIITLFYFIVTIGILVFVHELGHFLTAKMFGMRVDVFSIGFPPRAFGKTIGDTDYCVSWIPIGGYVKIAGMIDESMDTGFLNKAPEPWEFRSKPIWQRMIVMVGGVAMNILLAILIFWGITLHQGKFVQPNSPIGFIEEGSLAASTGFRQGDLVTSVNGILIQRWEDIERTVYTKGLSEDVVFAITRNGRDTSLTVLKGSIIDEAGGRFGIAPAGITALINLVESNSPAEKGGIRSNDIILTFNGDTIHYLALVPKIKSSAGTEIRFGIQRGDSSFTLAVTPSDEGRIGVQLSPKFLGSVEHIQYTLFSALPVAVSDTWMTTGVFIQNIYQIVIGEISFAKSVGGPVKIAQFATQSAERGLISFLGFMALLSMSLAILNLLPFPALDGGHILILSIEGVIRREIPPKIKIGIQQAGFFILLAFMAFVIFNDIRNL